MTAETSSVTAAWSRAHAAVYDPLVALGERWFLGRLRRDLVAGVEGRVLDLGAGTGRTFPYLVDAAVEVHAVEPDGSMRRRGVDRARRLGLDVSFYAAVGEALPFADGSIDAAVVSLVLCSVDDRDAVRRELARVVAPGGEVRLLEHVRGGGLRGLGQRVLAPVWRPVAGGCDLASRQHTPYFDDPAFEVVSAHEHHVGLFPFRPFVSLRLRRR